MADEEASNETVRHSQRSSVGMTDLFTDIDSRPTLVVHIGGSKSGSTAIQDFLFANRERLATIGIAVPNTEMEYAEGRANQIWFFQNLIEKEESAEVIAAQLRSIEAEFEKKHAIPARVIVISAENLSNCHDLACNFERLRGSFRIFVVLYIRRQEDAYQAAWQQWFVKTGENLEDWLASTKADFCDWAATLDRWERARPDATVVRIFDRNELVGNDIVNDFCKVLGLNIDTLRRPNMALNPSFGVHVSDLYHSMSAVFEGPHDLKFEAQLYKLGVQSAQKRPNEWIFSKAQLEMIRIRHAEGNARVRSRYFPNHSSILLFPPVPESDVMKLPQDEINRRNIGVLAEMMFKYQLATDEEIGSLRTECQNLNNRVDALLKLLTEADDAAK